MSFPCRSALVFGLLFLSLVAVLAGGASQAAPLNGIKGEDDRVEVEARRYPWSTVGRVNNGMGSHCSGVLIGPRLAVTAAHCLWNRKTLRPVGAGSLHFVAGYDRGRYVAASGVQSYVLAPAWQFAVPYSASLVAVDWALLVLEQPLGDQVGWVAVGRSPGLGQAVVTVGYGQDKAHIPAAHRGCRITGRLPEGALTDDCDAVKGDSGAPVLVAASPLPRLAAIHVATLGMAGGRYLGGVVGADAFLPEALRLGAAKESRVGPLSLPMQDPFLLQGQ